MTVANNPNDHLLGGITPHANRRRFWAWRCQSRGTRVLCILTALWCLGGLDLGCSIHAQRHYLLTAYTECNPVASRVLPAGPVPLVAYKVLLLLGGTPALIMHRRRLLVEIGASFTLVVYALVTTQWALFYTLPEVREVLLQIRPAPGGPIYDLF